MSDRNNYYYGGQRPRRGPNFGRLLAPLFLAAVIAGTYLIVHHGVQTLTNHTSSSASSTAVHVHKPKIAKKYRKAKVYVVQPGDSLSAIASKTGVRLATLKHLNPRVQPNALQLGQRLRLRR